MKKEDEIKIYRVENGFVVKVLDGRGVDFTLVYVYNHPTHLLMDMERFLSREKSEESAEERSEREAAERREAEIMEE